MKNQPIGFMDSGVGGLSVIKEALKYLPNETLYFIGDSARNPYGSRPMAEVQEFSKELARFLIKKDIKLLVVACNTATVAALEVLKQELDIPVIGVIEPGSKSAAKTTKNNKIGVIATEGTIKSGEYEKKIKSWDTSLDVQSLACQSFVTIVEENKLNDKEKTEAVAEGLKYFKNYEMDTLVLGCTHFPLLEPYIQKYFGEEVTLIDPGIETAKLIKQYLIENNLENEEQNQQKSHIFYTTGSASKFNEIAENWLEIENFSVEHVSLKELVE